MPQKTQGDTTLPKPSAPAAAKAPVKAAQYDAPPPTAPVAATVPVAAEAYDARVQEHYLGPKVDILKAGLAGRLDISRMRTEQMFQDIDPQTIRQTPFTIAHTTTANQDEGLTQAVNDTVVWFSTAYGNEVLGAYVLSNLIQDPVSRDRTQAVLFDIAGMTAQAAPQTTLGVAPQTLDTSSDEISNALSTVLGSPDPARALKNLDPSTQSGVISLAQQLMASITQASAQGSTVADQFGRVVAVALNGYRTVLDPADTAALGLLVKNAAGGLGGTTTGNLGSTAESLGVVQVRHLGGGVLVLDEEWARAHPDKALAEKEFLQAQYPEAQITIGKQGILGSVLDKFGMAIDYATAPIGAALHLTSEELNRFGSGNREANLNAVADAQAALDMGQGAPAWVRSLMHQYGKDPNDPEEVKLFLQHMTDQNTVDVGFQSFFHDLNQNTRPQMLGFGLADNIMRSADMLPGDPEYDYAHTAVGIVTQFALDPAMWAPAVIGGLRDAGVLSRVLGDLGGVPILGERNIEIARQGLWAKNFTTATETVPNILKVSESAIHQFVYSKFARTADEAVQTRAFLNGASKMYEARVAAGSEEAFATYLTMVGVDMKRARRIASMVTSPEGAGIALLDDALGRGNVSTVDDVYHIQSKLDEVNAQLAVRGGEEAPAVGTGIDVAEHTDLVAQKHIYESVLEGHDPIRDPTTGFMGGKQVRRLRVKAGLKPNAWDHAVDAIGHSIAEFPANIVVANSDRLRAIEEANPGAGPAIQAMFARLGHLWRNPGYGTRFVFEDTTELSQVTGVQQAREAIDAATKAKDPARLAIARQQMDSALANLVNTPNTSLDALHSIATENGISDSRFAQLIEPYASGQLQGDRAAQFQWFKDTWNSIHDESTTLDGLGRKGMKELYQVHYDDRNGARLTLRGTGGDVTTEAVLTKEIPGVEPYVLPTIDADLVRSVDMADLAQYRSYATVTGRHMKAWQAAGGARRAISTVHGSIASGWRTATSWWRSWILGSRIFGALPLRIIGEQQLRMAGFDYASAMWHPGEWFASTNWGRRYFTEEAAMWDAAGSPVHALGAMVDDMRGKVARFNDAKVTLNGSLVGEQESFFRAYSATLNKYAVSPSVTRWRLTADGLAEPDQVLRAIGTETSAPLRDTWLANFGLTRKIGDTRPESEIIAEAVGRWDLEMKQLVGYDPEDIIKDAIRHKTLEIDGEMYTVGTPAFAKKLEQLHADGRWDPGMRQLPGRIAEYLPGDKTQAMKGFTNKLFGMFYSRPDLATSRVPLYRQIFKRNYENFIRLGYDEPRAIEIARSLAAEGTADMLFQLGAHTNGEYLLREIMPFFPAYRELATTWIGRIPARIGQLSESHAAAVGWVIGAGALSERANLVLKSAKELGLVSEDPNGGYYVNAPVFGNILSWMTFGNVKFNSHVPLESLAGILPVPFGLSATDDQGRPLPWNERLRGMLPTLGGPAVAALAALKGVAPAFFGPVEDWTTAFGSDQSLGIPLVDQIIEGITHNGSPFALGRAGVLRDAQVQFAIIDGMRLAIHENPMPPWPGPNLSLAQQAAYEKEWTAWRDSIIKQGENYQTHLYVMKSLLGAVLPFSINYTDEYKQEIATMWQMVNHAPGGSGSVVGSVEMKLFLQRNPDLAPFLAGKTLDTRLYDDPTGSLKDFMDAVASGDVVTRNSNDWVTYAVGTTSYSEHIAKTVEIRSHAGKTWQEVLLNFDARGELSAESDRWQAYLDWNHNHMADLGINDMRTMLDQVNQYKAIRMGNEPSITLDQERLIAFDRSMRHYASYFDLNPENAGKYSDMRQAAYDALFKSLGAPSAISKGISDWFKNTADPYYSKLDKLYGQLDTAKPLEIGTVYSEIRQLSDAYDARARKSGDPTPEEYSFLRKTPDEQHQVVAKWAALPATYLTAFQRQQVGYVGDPAALTKYSNYAATTDVDMRQYALDHGITQGSSDWDRLSAIRDAALAQQANKLGIAQTVNLEYNAPTYQRVGHALDLTGTPDWDKIVGWVGSLNQYLATVRGGTGVSSAGSTTEAIRGREIFGGLVEDLRKNNPELDAALTTIGTAVDKANHYDLYDYLFFDKFF